MMESRLEDCYEISVKSFFHSILPPSNIPRLHLTIQEGLYCLSAQYCSSDMVRMRTHGWVNIR